jgi:hypothetical protein
MLVHIGAQSAQTTPPGRVIHLWVDPIYGSDLPTTGAPGQNPNATTPYCSRPPPGLPLAVRNGAGASLLHAPWPFKTLTAAVAYIRANSPLSPPLPYITNGFTVEAAIIHLLPRLYVPQNP